MVEKERVNHWSMQSCNEAKWVEESGVWAAEAFYGVAKASTEVSEDDNLKQEVSLIQISKV